MVDTQQIYTESELTGMLITNYVKHNVLDSEHMDMSKSDVVPGIRRSKSTA